jgi:hypothetical protein
MFLEPGRVSRGQPALNFPPPSQRELEALTASHCLAVPLVLETAGLGRLKDKPIQSGIVNSASNLS